MALSLAAHYTLRVPILVSTSAFLERPGKTWVVMSSWHDTRTSDVFVQVCQQSESQIFLHHEWGDALSIPVPQRIKGIKMRVPRGTENIELAGPPSPIYHDLISAALWDFHLIQSDVLFPVESEGFHHRHVGRMGHKRVHARPLLSRHEYVLTRNVNALGNTSHVRF